MRKTTHFNQGWRFKLGDETSSHLPQYDDSLWEEVHLPHCVQIAPIISSGGRNYQGVCRYRKHFTLEPSMENEKVILEFEGAMQVLEVWINDHQLPSHYCGYTPAVYDITSYISYTDSNVLAVRLDNSDRNDVPPGKPQERLDFAYEGGLYRGVTLYQTPGIYITHPLLEDQVAGGGIWVRTEDISEANATVHIQSHIRNEYDQSVSYQLKQTVIDQSGSAVAKVITGYELDSQDERHIIQSCQVNNPHLWHPHSPYMYQVRTEIIQEDNVIDQVVTPLGIRDFAFTRDKGFLINGKQLKVSGANYHQTYIHVGNAMPDSLLKRDARKYREAGMLHIRSHYPFAKAFIDECDRLGIMLIISSPGWQYYEEGIFVERVYKNLRDIVRWLRNHPSIILWEPILNESVMPESFQQRVHEIVHEELPLGPCYTGSDQGFSDVVYREFDPGMLGPKSEDYDPEAYMAMKKRFDKPRWVREYGDSPDNFTDQNCAWRVPRSWGEDIMLKQVRRMIWDKQKWLSNYTSKYNDETLCGFGMWPGMEHNRGYHINPCWGGFLDLHRIPKYSFYFFKSQRDPDHIIPHVESGPIVFIANYWSDVSPDDITVFSNCEKLRLYHNDVFIEEREPDDIPIKHPPTTFMNQFYYGRDRSEIRVEGIIDGEVVAVDKRFTPGVPRQLHLEPDDMTIDMQADGSDILFVRCDVHDDHGQITPLTLDAHDIIFTIDGPGKIIGDFIKRPELGQTGVIVQSTTEPGTISIKAELLYPQKYSRIAVKSALLDIKTQ
ncbi:sugar-binding domain-containing protein [Vallitalea okinawensis]|uniref:sugar-binding domain-containing protein n=1 Tax=Vallitalea okinawensis TaxID=2078660 RepID=UPI000CFB9029|nr:sugar-binding domain-containing protein [Vallitalea okinawensis]